MQISMPIKGFICLLLLSTLTKPALGYEALPEYQVLQNRNLTTRPSSLNIDSEYQSDLLTYYYPFSWYGTWLSQSKVLQLSSGSISSKRFAVDNRLKLTTSLSDNFLFSFYYLDLSHLEKQDEAHIVDFEYRLSSKFSIAIYGESETFKSENSLGGALIWIDKNQGLHRLFYTAPDFDYNKRNEHSDSYKKLPKSIGYVYRWVQESEYYEATARFDLESERLFPSEDSRQISKGHYFAAKSRTRINLEDYLHAQLTISNASLKEYSVSQNSPDSFSKLNYFKNEYWLQWERTRPLQGQNGNFLLGLLVADRIWQTERGHVRHQNYLPHAWWLWSHNKGKYSVEWGLGWESTLFKSRGPQALRNHHDTRSEQYEHRANASYQIDFPTGNLRLLFTFDVDKFGTEETWEGGAAQLTVHY